VHLPSIDSYSLLSSKHSQRTQAFMAKASVLVSLALLVACCVVQGSRVSRARRADLQSNVTDVQLSTEESAEEGTQESEMGCRNYCVQCNDGSTVWYGRDKNWIKAGATVVLGGVGWAAAGSGIGTVGAIIGGAAAGVAGYSAGVSNAEETHTHWSGALPTTGFFCEKVDVLKFKKTEQCAVTPFMEQSEKYFGRVKNNKLKPYDEHGKLKTPYGLDAAKADEKSYRDGCKVVKASGTKALQQLTWKKTCKSAVTHGIHTCSHHSALCGAAGVSGTTNAKTADSCQKQCATGGFNDLKCQAKNQQHQTQQNQQYQSQPNQQYQNQQNTNQQYPNY